MDELMANYAGIVFAKTDKGREEMASRAHGLNPPQRRVLIIVDGVRNFETIVDIIPSIIPKDQMGE
ncbi:MAG: hypothetical protein JSS58_03040, partial [Proteobacteria bacterium]|nr:hypothetical protein [Pseudomonadota bacterium]